MTIKSIVKQLNTPRSMHGLACIAAGIGAFLGHQAWFHTPLANEIFSNTGIGYMVLAGLWHVLLHREDLPDNA